MELWLIALLFGGLIKYITSDGSSSPPNESNKSVAPVAAPDAAVGQAYDYVAAQEALDSQTAAERQAAVGEFHRDLDEFLRARQSDAPIPDRLLRGSFPQRLRIMAEKQRRERQVQGSGSSPQN